MALASEFWMITVKREREQDLIRVGRQFRDAIGRYYESTPGGAKQYPPRLEELIQDSRFPAMRRHLRKIFIDPVTGKADWDLVKLNGRVVGVKSRSTDAPIKVAGFDLTESSFQGREKYSEWVFTYPHDLLLRPESALNTPKTPMLPGQPLNGGQPAAQPFVQTATGNQTQFPPLTNEDVFSNEAKP